MFQRCVETTLDFCQVTNEHDAHAASNASPSKIRALCCSGPLFTVSTNSRRRAENGFRQIVRLLKGVVTIPFPETTSILLAAP